MPSALDRSGPGLKSAPQLPEAIALRRRALEDGVSNHRAVGRDAHRKGIANSAGPRRLAALRCRDLFEQRPSSGKIALHVALQEAGEDLAMTAGTRLGAGFEKPRR